MNEKMIVWRRRRYNEVDTCCLIMGDVRVKAVLQVKGVQPQEEREMKR